MQRQRPAASARGSLSVEPHRGLEASNFGVSAIIGETRILVPFYRIIDGIAW